MAGKNHGRSWIPQYNFTRKIMGLRRGRSFWGGFGKIMPMTGGWGAAELRMPR